MLQAQQELFPQQLNLAQTRYAVYNALVNLYKAMGGGWDAAPAAITSMTLESGSASSNPNPTPAAPTGDHS